MSLVGKDLEASRSNSYKAHLRLAGKHFFFFFLKTTIEDDVMYDKPAIPTLRSVAEVGQEREGMEAWFEIEAYWLF